MSRFVKTRWLCPERCCDKEQQKCPALKSLFTSRTGSNLRQDKGNEEDDEKSTEKRFKRLKKAFTGPLIEVYISVFTSALLLFTHYNLFLQWSDPQAHNVHPMTQSLIKKMHPVFWKGKGYQMWPSRMFKMSQTASSKRYARKIQYHVVIKKSFQWRWYWSSSVRQISS